MILKSPTTTTGEPPQKFAINQFSGDLPWKIEARFKNMNVGSASSNSVPINQPIGAPVYQPSGTYPPANRSYQESFLFKANASKDYKENFLLKATTALEYYNSSHGDCFELVDCLYINDVTAFYWEEEKYTHLSFIARSKDPSPKIKLFFAEVCSDQVVKACTPVEPDNPLFCLGCGKCHPEGVIYHPVGNYEEGSRRFFNSPPAGKMNTLEKSAKKWLNKNYSFVKTVQTFSPGEHMELSKITNGYALKALRYYCGLQEREYELSEILASVRFGDRHAGEAIRVLDALLYVHVTFTAKNKDPHCLNDTSEHFFAELKIDEGGSVNTCVNMTQAGLASCEVETICKACRLHCNMVHPKGRYYAGIAEGIFADAQDKKRAWGVKVELQEKKVGTPSNAARAPVIECDTHLRLQSGDDLPTCLPKKGRSRKKLAARGRQSKKNTSK